MVRIKVYKLSHLIIGFLAFLLLVALIVIAVNVATSQAAPASAIRPSSDIAWSTEQEAVTAFAVTASSAMFPGERKLVEVVFDDENDDNPAENEHTDAVDDEFIVEIVPPSMEKEYLPETFAGEQIRILIYHTHTHEAYAQTPDDPYVQTEQWRTTDPNHSIVRVGEELAKLLRARGFDVVHDDTDHEPPKLGTAYERSLKTLEKYDETFDVYIDLHRDAYVESIQKGVVAVSGSMGTRLAQIMVLLGNGEGFNTKPDLQANYQFSKAISDQLEAKLPGLSRGVQVKNGRYNQHVGTPAILIEAGNNLNTLQEVLASMPFLADAIDAVLSANE